MPYFPEPFPQPVLIVTDLGSTYIEVLWVLPEDSKTNTARKFVPLPFSFNLLIIILFFDFTVFLIISV